MDLGRGADLLDAAIIKDHDPVGERHRFGLIVGHRDQRRIDADHHGSPEGRGDPRESACHHSPPIYPTNKI